MNSESNKDSNMIQPITQEANLGPTYTTKGAHPLALSRLHEYDWLLGAAHACTKLPAHDADGGQVAAVSSAAPHTSTAR